MKPNQKAPELALRGCQFQLIGLRSEVAGDAQAARDGRRGVRSHIEPEVCARRPTSLVAEERRILLRRAGRQQYALGDTVPVDRGQARLTAKQRNGAF
jgi:hypothetical protein